MGCVNFLDITHKQSLQCIYTKTCMVKITTAASCNYARLMSPKKDETGCRLTRMLLLLVVRWSLLFIIDGKKYLNFVDDGWNKHWLKVLIFVILHKFFLKMSKVEVSSKSNELWKNHVYVFKIVFKTKLWYFLYFLSLVW